MRIYALVAARNYSDVAEVMAAWDEYCFDSNPEGWEQAKREAIAELEKDEAWREVIIEVPNLENLFAPKVVKGTYEEI